MNNIRVLIADDHGIVREGLRSLMVNAGFDVVGEACNGTQAIEQTTTLEPDIVLLDIRMPEIDGLQALAAIKMASPKTSVIILTTYANPQYLAKAIACGAAAFLSKDIEPERLPKVVQAVAEGEYLIEPALLQMAFQNPYSECEPYEHSLPDAEPLTEREIQTLQLIAAGLNNNQIAEVLFISRSTVKTHVRHIFEKLHVTDRTQAALWAARNGILPPE